jgi:hypothetical protein
MNSLDEKRVRMALSKLPQNIAQEGEISDTPPASTYVPPSHARALDPDTTLVEGIRGAGKSFWWAALSSDEHRQFISKAFQNLRIGAEVEIRQGFGTAPKPTMAPSADTIEQLSKSYSPRSVWRAVVATHADFGEPFPLKAVGDVWAQRVSWVFENPERYEELLWKADQALENGQKTRLILFDALDRLASQWNAIRPLAKAVLQVALDLRSTRRIRFKVFVRPDMIEDRDIISFPDFSKLNANKASLLWRRLDLYALLFQRIGNSHEAGPDFRAFTESHNGMKWKGEGLDWILPPKLTHDEDAQEQIFIAIAGKAMGPGPSGFKRGKPYSWLVNHLIDGRFQVSPRSFLSAVGKAAAETPMDHPQTLSPRGIQNGVQQASRIRVDELKNEDYPWVEDLMKHLRGNLTVPCSTEDIFQIWDRENTLKALKDQLSGSQNNVKLPPRRLKEGPRAVLEDLAELGLIQILPGGRVQMPDVYRIAFGIGRRGGVRPLK